MVRKFAKSAACLVALVGCSGAARTGNSAAGTQPHAAPPTVFTINKVPLAGEGRGDYLTIDPAARRLYVTHSAVVHIVDLDTLTPVAEVTGLKAAHGVGLANGHGFVSDGDQNAVIEFDPATGKTLATIPTEKKPDSIVFDPASGMIMVSCGEAAEIDVIDPAKNVVVKTIKLPSDPEFSRVDGKGKLWVNLGDGNDIGVIDTRTMMVTGTIPLPGCDGPGPLAFDAVNRVLFSGCGNKVMTVTDADAGTVIARVPIGDDPDGIAFDPGRKRIYVANRAGGWTIVDQTARNGYAINQTLKIDDYAKTVTVDPATHRAFSSTADLIWGPVIPGKKHLPSAKSGTFRLMVISSK